METGAQNQQPGKKKQKRIDPVQCAMILSTEDESQISDTSSA